jgi:hypothetical protein
VLAYIVFEGLTIGGLAILMYADRRDSQRILANLRTAQVQRSTQARQVLESQLQAMQARVEPQFLFNTLGRINQLYDVDAVLGEQMLDDLIVYLRPRFQAGACAWQSWIAVGDSCQRQAETEWRVSVNGWSLCTAKTQVSYCANVAAIRLKQ